MANRISRVIQNKNRTAKARKRRQKDDLNKLRAEAAYRANTAEHMKDIDSLLDIPGVSAILIQAPEKLMAQFSGMLYSPELAEYTIAQDGRDPGVFDVSRKYVAF